MSESQYARLPLQQLRLIAWYELMVNHTITVYEGVGRNVRPAFDPVNRKWGRR